MLQLISLVMLVYSYFLIRINLPKLPPSIPTHFNAAGVADGWGSPDTLWILFGIQALCCALFLLMPYIGRRYPGAIHVGWQRLSDFSPAERARMTPMLNDMAAYLGIAMSLFFVFALNEIIKAASEPLPHIQMFWPLAIFVGGTLGITLYYMVQFRRAAKREPDGDPRSSLTP